MPPQNRKDAAMNFANGEKTGAVLTENLPAHDHRERVKSEFVTAKLRGNGFQAYGTSGKIYFLRAEPDVEAPLSNWEMVQEKGYLFFEVAASFLTLCFSLPVMLLIGLAIKLDSPGPALFFQRRFGKSRLVSGTELLRNKDFMILDGNISPEARYWVPQTFRIVKFRTMHQDARERYPEWYNFDYSSAEQRERTLKVKNDPRVTRVGNWFRSATLDELPNFWSVLKGEMRLVGPRAKYIETIINYRPEEMAEFTVRPGITGLAQVQGRSHLTFHKTLAYDLEYVRTRSIRGDFKILLQTIRKVCTREGAI